MKFEGMYLSSVDDAVEWILGYFVDNPRDTRVIYFDGWRGFGASTVLRGVADAVTSRRTPPELHLDKVIHIDCSAWKSRRATQRAIAVELKLDHSVMAAFDKEDEEDDFNGVDEGSRSEILGVGEIIDRDLRDHRFMIIFHNGSGDDIDLSSFGVPPCTLFRANLMLWTFRRRFRARELYSEMQNKVKSAHFFVYEPGYDIASEEGIFFPVLRREAAAIAGNYPCMRETNPERIVRCCLYELFLHLSFPKITEYDWPARASSYWMCDGIIQGDRAWEITNALREEIKWELHPDSLDVVRQRFLNEQGSSTLTFKDKLDGGQQPYPWIAITSRNNLQTEDMLQAINAKVSSCFLASGTGSPDHVPLVLADGLFNQSTNLRVLHLSCCAFSFASPPFSSCHNLRFLGLDHCKDSIAGEGEDQRKWEFLRSLWALDLSHTDWYQVLSKEMTDLMELNVVGVEFSRTSLVWGQMHNLHMVRIIKPVYPVPETSANVDNTFIGKTKLQLLDLSGNKDMKILPSSLSTASSLEVLILDGCNDLENVAAPDRLPPSLKSLSLDGYGPASHWTPVVELPPKKFRPSSADQKHVKITKISLEGCTQLENLFLRGLPNLVELDLSGTVIKTLDFQTMVVEVPRLKRLYLLGCERLRAIKWGPSGPELELLCIDTRAGIELPSFDLNKSFRLQVHATVADARFARSLWFPISYKDSLVDVYFNIRITSSPGYSSGVESTSEEKIGLGDHQVSLQQLVPANRYGDVISMVGDAPMHAFPQPPSTKLDRHIEIAQGSCSVESELVAYPPRANLAYLMNYYAESLHVHDVSITAGMPSGYWEYLRQCRVESCPTLETVFPPGAYGFEELQTIWASDLLMASCVWSKGSRYDSMSFSNLQHLHLRSCTRLQFVLPVRVSSFPSLETLHIIHCSDLRHVFVLDEKYPQTNGVAFPKLTTVHLHDLPMLRQICEVKMVAPALETMRIRGCWGMRRLPAVAAHGEGEKKLIVEIEKDVWDALEWDGVEAGHHSSLFETRHSRYYKKELPRVSVLR